MERKFRAVLKGDKLELGSNLRISIGYYYKMVYEISNTLSKGALTEEEYRDVVGREVNRQFSQKLSVTNLELNSRLIHIC